MVGVAQLVERWIVAPVAVGSNPIAHPFKKLKALGVSVAAVCRPPVLLSNKAGGLQTAATETPRAFSFPAC